MGHITQQIRIIKLLQDNGGEMKTKAIAKAMGLTRYAIHASCKHLLNRGFVKKQTVNLHVFSPGTETTWSLNKKSMPRMNQLIREAYPNDYTE